MIDEIIIVFFMTLLFIVGLLALGSDFYRMGEEQRMQQKVIKQYLRDNNLPRGGKKINVNGFSLDFHTGKTYSIYRDKKTGKFYYVNLETYSVEEKDV